MTDQYRLEPDRRAAPQSLICRALRAHTSQVVTSTDKVVARATLKDINTQAIAVEGAGCSFRAVRCRFEGGAECGVRVDCGGTADLEACSLGLTALSAACKVLGRGSSAVLRRCRIEGRSTKGGGHPLDARCGGSLALEDCNVDVEGTSSAALAEGAGAGAGGLEGLGGGRGDYMEFIVINYI